MTKMTAAKLDEAWSQCLSQDTIDIQEMKRLMGLGFDVPNHSVLFTRAKGRSITRRSLEYITGPREANPYPAILAWMDAYQDSPDWFGGEEGMDDAGYHVMRVRTPHHEGRLEVLERLLSDERWIAVHGSHQAGLDAALRYAFSAGGDSTLVMPTFDFLIAKGANPYALDPEREIHHQTYIEMVAEQPSLASRLDKSRVSDAMREFLALPDTEQDTVHGLLMQGLDFANHIARGPHLFELSDEELACAMLLGLQVKGIDGPLGNVSEIEALFEKHGSAIANWHVRSYTILTCAILGRAPVELIQWLLDAGADPFKAYPLEEGEERTLLLWDHHTGINGEEVRPSDEVARALIKAMVKRMKADNDFGDYRAPESRYIPAIKEAWLEHQATLEQAALDASLPQATKKGGRNPIHL